MLDPSAFELTQWARATQRPGYQAIGAVAARALYEKAATAIDLPAQPMAHVDDFDVTLPQRTLRLRRYVPGALEAHSKGPALLFFHGGGFTIGSRESHDRLCRLLAHEADCLVLSLAYRLAPEHRFPAAFDDAFEGLEWVVQHAAALGVDTAQLAVGGDSAGGTLAAATALHARDRGLPVGFQWLLYPGTTTRADTDSRRRYATGYLLDAEVISWFYGHFVEPDQARDWRIAPLDSADVTGVASAWVGVAGYDPLMDEGVAYAQKLREHGVAVETEVFEGLLHGFAQHRAHIFTADLAVRSGAEALRRGLRRLER